MPDAFRQALEATIHYVEGLRDAGTRNVRVAPETMAALLKPARRPPTTTRPPSPTPRTPTQTTPAALTHTTPSPATPAAQPTMTPTAKEQAIAELRTRVLACQKCPNLASSRQNVVFGVGDIHSPLMFVGEAPGADEDLQGEPFVGKAGQLLTRIIETTGLNRSKVFIANVLKCRPDTPNQSSGNRKPTTAEMTTCLPYLVEQIRIIQPQIIVALGATAVEGLFGRPMPITRIRGTWLEFQGIPVMPTYHPAYLLRNQSLSEKRRVWEDMLQVMERLGLPISEKQRGFFLNRS